MMLDRNHVEPPLIGQQEFVDAFLEQVGGYLRVAVAVGQARTHRRRAIEHVLRHVGIRYFALVPDVHVMNSNAGYGMETDPEVIAWAPCNPSFRRCNSARFVVARRPDNTRRRQTPYLRYSLCHFSSSSMRMM